MLTTLLNTLIILYLVVMAFGALFGGHSDGNQQVAEARRSQAHFIANHPICFAMLLVFCILISIHVAFIMP